LDQGGLFQASTQFWGLELRLDLVKDVASRMIRLLGLLVSLCLSAKSPQCEVRLPQLRRIANGLGNGQSLVHRRLGFGPLVTNEGDFAFEPPAFDEVFARMGTGCHVQTSVGELLCLTRILVR